MPHSFYLDASPNQATKISDNHSHLPLITPLALRGRYAATPAPTAVATPSPSAAPVATLTPLGEVCTMRSTPFDAKPIDLPNNAVV